MDFELNLKTNAEFVEGQAALQAVLGEPPTLEWMTRLTKKEGDAWKLRVMHPARDLKDPDITRVFCSAGDPLQLFNNPWIAPEQVLGIVVKEHDLTAQTVELLQGPNSPELEIRRRRELARAHEEKIEGERVAVLARQAQARKHDLEERQRDLEFRTKEWEDMVPIAQVLIRSALAIEEGKGATDMAVVLREMAAEANNRKGSLKAPRRVWWAS